MEASLTTLFSETHTLYMTTLNNNNFQQFANSKNLQELIVKLANTSYRKIIDKPIQTNKELSEKLDYYFKESIEYYGKFSVGGNLELMNLLKFIKSEYEINAFIYLLTANKRISEEELGFFESLNSFLYLNSLDQLFELNSPFNNYLLEIKNNSNFKIDFGLKFREKNNLQKLSLLLKKLNLENIYKQTKSEILKEILRNECDRSIIDVLFSLKNISKEEESKENMFNNNLKIINYFPTCTNFSDYQISQILSLQNPSISNLREILNIEVMTDDSITNIGQALFKFSNINDYSSLSSKFNWIEDKLYKDSFNIFNDISCIYSYLKIRELEIKKIKYISDCIEVGNTNINFSEILL